MFTDHFSSQTRLLKGSLEKSLKKGGAVAPENVKNPRILYQSFYTFLQEHLPTDFSVTLGRVRNGKQILKNSCDVLVYKEWCKAYLSMTGGYVFSQDLYTFLKIESSIDSQNLRGYISLTRAIKSLYLAQVKNTPPSIIPLYSVLFSYTSSRGLVHIKESLIKEIEKKEVPLNYQVDMICILGRGIILKDWEAGGSYRGIQTGEDTLMWFYILLMEYLDRDGKMQINLRDYIKSNRNYSEC